MTKPRKKPTRKPKWIKLEATRDGTIVDYRVIKPAPKKSPAVCKTAESSEVTPQAGEPTSEPVTYKDWIKVGNDGGHAKGLREGRIETIFWVLIIAFIGFLIKGAVG